MAFCDYCPCEDCKKGAAYVSHAKTADGLWICDICYLYDVCASVMKRDGTSRPGGSTAPCDDKNCVHRPKLASEWIKGKKR